jgi:hypothetical protein
MTQKSTNERPLRRKLRRWQYSGGFGRWMDDVHVPKNTFLAKNWRLRVRGDEWRSTKSLFVPDRVLRISDYTESNDTEISKRLFPVFRKACSATSY